MNDALSHSSIWKSPWEALSSATCLCTSVVVILLSCAALMLSWRKFPSPHLCYSLSLKPQKIISFFYIYLVSRLASKNVTLLLACFRFQPLFFLESEHSLLFGCQAEDNLRDNTSEALNILSTLP